MKTIRISTKQAEEFFRNEVLFEDSRIDGYTIDEMVKLTTDGYHFISSQLKGVIIAATAFKTSPDGRSAEVHTFVLPEYRKHSTEALKAHIDYFEHLKISYLFTYCSDFNRNVINFLCKRLGFVVFKEEPYENFTRDGEPITIYSLMKVV